MGVEKYPEALEFILHWGEMGTHWGANRSMAQVHALLFLEGIGEVIDYAHVEIFTAEKGIAVGGQHFELVLAIDFGNFDHRHVEGTATQVVYRHHLVLLLVLPPHSSS